MSVHGQIVSIGRSRSGADPIVIATAEYYKATVVTGEPASNKIEKPRIPDVCKARNVDCIGFTEMIRREGWKF